MSRIDDLNRFYGILDELRDAVGGHRYLKHCNGRSGWPERGVYFFFEQGERRENRRELRVTRVGTHALKAGSGTSLWNRLSQHRGTVGGNRAGGGNHRGSIFRLHVGTALLARSHYPTEIGQTWGRASSAGRDVVEAEHPLELDISEFIGSMPFLWLGVLDSSGPDSARGVIEANAVGLLSNRGGAPIDPPSPKWLGCHAGSPAVRESGLWNVNYVDARHDPSFLDVLAEHVRRTDF